MKIGDEVITTVELETDYIVFPVKSTCIIANKKHDIVYLKRKGEPVGIWAHVDKVCQVSRCMFK